MLTFVFLISTALVLGAFPVASVADCVLSNDNGPAHRPLFTSGTAIMHPSGSNGGFNIPAGTTFTASCTPAANSLESFKVNQVDVTCSSKGKLIVNQVETTYSQLGCVDAVREEIVRSGAVCYKQNFANISIEFDNAAQSFPIISLCHDEKNFNTIMSRHVIYGERMSTAEISNCRPSFKKAQFYTGVSPQAAYAQSSQKTIVQSLVNSAALAEQYIDPAQSFYFARGHLAPDGDFIDVPEQNATYYFVNVFPQWQAINNGNWKAMELAIRQLAKSRNATFNIYTGGFDTLKLKDVNNNLVDIYLARDPTTEQLVLPVPKLTWKIVHDPKLKTAVAIIMVNNPHELNIPADDILCSSVCDQIKWITWDKMNVRKGYTYCCPLSAFKSKVEYAPKLGSVKLLV